VGFHSNGTCLDLYHDVQPRFDQSFPDITFVHCQSHLVCEVSVGKEKKDVLLSALLHQYASLDKRVSVLGICLRKWGQLCRLDDPLVGTLPAVAFPLMVIFFLQQVKPPVVPVLQEVSQDVCRHWNIC
jgi:terminal uridylyltransferase